MHNADFPAVRQAEDGPASRSRKHAHDSKSACLRVITDQGGGRTPAPFGNISDRDQDLDRSAQLNLNDCVILTLPSIALNGRIVWLNGEDCGIALDNQFNYLVNVARHDEHASTLTHIAVPGMEAVNDGNFQPGLRVQVVLPDGSEQGGLVRWTRENIAGVVLLQHSPDKPCSIHRPTPSDHAS